MTSTQDRLDADSGLDEPAPRRLTRRATLLLAGAGVVVLVVVGTWVVAFSSLLGVRNVDVHGLHALSAPEVRRAAGITDGTPLVRVDTVGATERVERLPEVRSAQVRTSMPSTVVITVVERTPVGYLQRGGSDHLVDSTGAQFRTVAHAPAGLPLLITGGTDAATRAVARVAAGVPRRLLASVHSIQALDPQAITIVLPHSRVVQWGTSSRSAFKGRVLQALLGLKHSRYATTFDVSDPDQPYTH